MAEQLKIIRETRWVTTTTGKRRDEIPPGGNERSLFNELGILSGYPPFTRYDWELLETLELATEPFPAALEGSIFMSVIFLTFFSWTCQNYN